MFDLSRTLFSLGVILSIMNCESLIHSVHIYTVLTPTHPPPKKEKRKKNKRKIVGWFDVSEWWKHLIWDGKYHSWELPQVSFCHKYHFCRDKHMVVTTKHLLLWQKYACCDICCDKIFLMRLKSCCNKYLLRQTHVCCNKHVFVTTKDVFCCHKHVFVVTKVSLSPEACVCHNKGFVMTKICLLWQNFCSDKHTFVATKDMWQTRVCHDKTFVATKMILVAAPAIDGKGAWTESCFQL